MKPHNIQRCVLATVTLIILVNTVSGTLTTLHTDVFDRTITRPMYSLINSNEVNTIVITSITSLHFVTLHVKTTEALNQTQCELGGHKVYSGGSPDAGYYVGTFCGGSSWDSFVTSHSSAVIVLDNTMADSTATMTIKYDTQIACGSGVTASRNPRYIRSPFYPHGGPFISFKTCSWILTAPSDGRVRITIKHSQNFYTPNCQSYNVTIMDGVSLRFYRRNIGLWCGQGQSSFISWENKMGILAKDLERFSYGFEIEYVAEQGERCEQKINGDEVQSGVITSPGYPHGYKDLLECRWEIRTSEKKNIRFIVVDSNLTPNCTTDNIKVYNSNEASLDAVVTWCGIYTSSYEFYASILLLVFKAGSDHSLSYTGFKLKYEINTDPKCGSNFTAIATSQHVQTEGYPKPFRGVEQCMWLIKASNPRKVVKLSVYRSDLFSEVVCRREKVSVYNGQTVSEDRRLGTWCGRSHPTYRSSSQYMLVVFSSTKLNTLKKTGFRADFVEDECGAEKSTMSYPLWITSPGYPSNYESGYNCFWNLTASRGAIGIRVTDLDVRCSDSLFIYDGEMSRFHRNWCGTGKHSYLSTSLKLYIQFSTTTNQGRGFNLTYSGYYNEGCGSYVKTIYPNKARTSWKSPGYPEGYFDNLLCRWRFAASSRVRVEFWIDDIARTGSDCTGDYIRVFDGYDNNARVVYNKLCYGYLVTVTSSKTYLYVEFVTDDSTTGKGFVMYYQTVGETLTSTEAAPSSSESQSGGSFNYWILIGGLTPTIIIVAIFVCIIVYLRCKYPGSSGSRNYRENEPATFLPPRANPTTRPDNRQAPSAPPNYEDLRSDPYAPPPSYHEVSGPPAELKANDDTLPPPSYSDAVQGGMIQNDGLHSTGASPNTITSYV